MTWHRIASVSTLHLICIAGDHGPDLDLTPSRPRKKQLLAYASPHSRDRKLLPSRGGSTGATPFYPHLRRHTLHYDTLRSVSSQLPTPPSPPRYRRLSHPSFSLHSRPHVSDFHSAMKCTSNIHPTPLCIPSNSSALQRHPSCSESFPIRAPCAPPIRSPTSYPALPHNHPTIDTVPYMSSHARAKSQSGASQYQGPVEIWCGPLAGMGVDTIVGRGFQIQFSGIGAGGCSVVEEGACRCCRTGEEPLAWRD